MDQGEHLGLRRSTLVQQVYDCLRDRIVRLDIKPGEKIDVQRLSKELGVSQTPIREALQKLVEQGLVVVRPYVGYFVVELTPKDAEELFDLRKALEVLALRYAYEKVITSDLDIYFEWIRKMEHLDEDTLVEETRRFDRAFHFSFILQKAERKWLMKYANGVLDLIMLTTRLSMNPKAAWEEHYRILEALACRDLASATAMLQAHIDRSKREAIALLEGGERRDDDQ